MKNLLIILLFITISLSGSAQCDPDTIAPTFEFPNVPLVYETFEEIPILWGPPYPDFADEVYSTLQDNCDQTPQLTSSVFGQSSNSITYAFTASDDQSNSFTNTITFFVDSCLNDTTPPVFVPYPPALIQLEDFADFVLPSISATDDCSDASVSWVLDNATNCATEECYVIEWFAVDESGNFVIEYTIIEVSNILSVDEFQTGSSLKVYPNPASGQFNVESDLQWNIYTINGKQVNRDHKNDLDPGMYFIRTEQETVKLIIK